MQRVYVSFVLTIICHVSVASESLRMNGDGPFPISLAPLFQNKSKCKNHCYESKFDLHENEPVARTHFHMNGFARRLVLTLRQKGTRKWPIASLTKTIFGMEWLNPC